MCRISRLQTIATVSSKKVESFLQLCERKCYTESTLTFETGGKVKQGELMNEKLLKIEQNITALKRLKKFWNRKTRINFQTIYVKLNPRDSKTVLKLDLLKWFYSFYNFYKSKNFYVAAMQ